MDVRAQMLAFFSRFKRAWLKLWTSAQCASDVRRTLGPKMFDLRADFSRLKRFPRESSLHRISSRFTCFGLEAQQRYFSNSAMLVAIVSQNYFVSVFMGHRTIIARYIAKSSIAQMCLCETKYQGQGGIAPFWESANLPEKVFFHVSDCGVTTDSCPLARLKANL